MIFLKDSDLKSSRDIINREFHAADVLIAEASAQCAWDRADAALRMVELLLGRLSSLGRPSPALAERLRRDAAEMRETMPVRYVNNPAPRCRTLRVGRVQLRWQRDATVAALTVERLGRGYRLVGGKADD